MSPSAREPEAQEPPDVTVYCIRHGETVYNVQGRIQGHLDVPLSPLGRRQSEAVAQSFRGRPIDALYASPLRRAQETAESVAGVLALPIQLEPRLIEIDVGVFQDKSRQDLETLYPEELARWKSGDPDYAIPQGESRRQLAQRGVAAIESIFRSGHRRIVVVSHGGWIVTVVKSLLGIPLGDPPYAVENASVTTLVWQVSGSGTSAGQTDGQGPDRAPSWLFGRVQLVSLGDVAHLADVGLAGQGDLAV